MFGLAAETDRPKKRTQKHSVKESRRVVIFRKRIKAGNLQRNDDPQQKRYISKTRQRKIRFKQRSLRSLVAPHVANRCLSRARANRSETNENLFFAERKPLDSRLVSAQRRGDGSEDTRSRAARPLLKKQNDALSKTESVSLSINTSKLKITVGPSMLSRLSRFLFIILALPAATILHAVDSHIDGPFGSDIQPLLEQYCIKCHGGEKVKGDVDFTTIATDQDVVANFELWELVADVLAYEEMPPEEAKKRPSNAESQQIQDWYQKKFVDSIHARPGTLQPRRLSAPEYRNTLRSLFGFDLEVSIIKAEQTVIERSLALKLLPTDPPGASGYVNDTHSTPLTTVTWEQYAYLADRALQELFSFQQHDKLENLIGQTLPPAFRATDLTPDQAGSLIRNFAPRALRRPVTETSLAPALSALKDLHGQSLLDATKNELKALLVSPGFIYRGLLFEGEPDKQQAVDSYELAERLSYFFWEDMPDETLSKSAANGDLKDPQKLVVQIDRMLASPKSRTLSESFAHQWFGLADIDDAASDATTREALRSQALDFLNYLFTENRPVIELIDSKTAFANYLTASFYPKDKAQLKKYNKPKGIERQLVPNQRITLEHATERGGLLTIPGILAMNRGPVLRGTWMLRKILGERLGEPPANVPAIEKAAPDAYLTFRERFDQHRSDSTCARCHDRIDPLGFAMQHYDDSGAYKLSSTYKAPRKKKEHDDDLESLDTSGQMPSGETFANYQELKSILLTTKRSDIIRNAVEQVLAYALCRKLDPFDRPTVDEIAQTIDETNGTWRDLFIEVSQSLPFQETYVSAPTQKTDS